MRIATVNVNGIRAAARKGISTWLEASAPDVLVLQEAVSYTHLTLPTNPRV